MNLFNRGSTKQHQVYQPSFHLMQESTKFLIRFTSRVFAIIFLSTPVLDLPVTENQKKKNEAKEAYEKIIEFISINHVQSESLKIPKLPSPSYEISVVEQAPANYKSFESIQNGDIFEPINSKPFHAEVAQARKLTRLKAAKTCWEVTLRVNDDLDREIHCGDCIALYTPNNRSEVDKV